MSSRVLSPYAIDFMLADSVRTTPLSAQESAEWESRHRAAHARGNCQAAPPARAREAGHQAAPGGQGVQAQGAQEQAQDSQQGQDPGDAHWGGKRSD